MLGIHPRCAGTRGRALAYATVWGLGLLTRRGVAVLSIHPPLADVSECVAHRSDVLVADVLMTDVLISIISLE